MAIGIENQSNIIAAGTAGYPNGDIKDRTGSTPGTPVNRKVYADIHQFFAKLLRLAGITANNTPDNETNGFQYITALEKFVNSLSGVWHYVGASGEPPFLGSFANASTDRHLKFKKDGLGNVSIQGVVVMSSGSGSIFTIPSDFCPTEEFSGAVIVAIDNVGATNHFFYRSAVETGGLVKIFNVLSSGPTPATQQLYVDIKYSI